MFGVCVCEREREREAKNDGAQFDDRDKAFYIKEVAILFFDTVVVLNLRYIIYGFFSTRYY